MPLYFTIGTANVDRFERLKQDYPCIDVDEEYFQALRSCFESIQLRTDKFIDLYNWKEFQGDELTILADVFEAKKKEIDATTEQIVVSIGKQINPDGSETDLIYRLEPASISTLLQRCLDLIGVAKIDGNIFVCKGD